MTRVPTLAQHQLTLFNTTNIQSRINDLQTQLATGQKSQTYAGIANDSLRLVTLEASRSQVQQFLSNIDKAQQRLTLMDAGMQSIDSLVGDFRQTLNSALTAPDSAGRDLKTLAANMRQMVVDLLNSSDGQSYLFGGTRTDRPPVDMSAGTYSGLSLIKSDGVTVDSTFYQDYYTQVQGNTLPFAQGSFYNQIFFDKNGVAPTGPLPADPDNPTLAEFSAEDPDLWQYYVDRLNSSEMVANPKTDYYQGNDQANTVRADRSLDLNYDIRADLPVFQQILAAFDAVANLPAGDASDPSERAILTKARNMLNDALSSSSGGPYESLDQIRTRAASIQQNAGAVKDRHQSFNTYATGVINDLEGIDQAEVIVRLQNDQQSLDASYAVMARLQPLSLLQYI